MLCKQKYQVHKQKIQFFFLINKNKLKSINKLSHWASHKSGFNSYSVREYFWSPQLACSLAECWNDNKTKERKKRSMKFKVQSFFCWLLMALTIFGLFYLLSHSLRLSHSLCLSLSHSSCLCLQFKFCAFVCLYYRTIQLPLWLLFVIQYGTQSTIKGKICWTKKKRVSCKVNANFCFCFYFYFWRKKSLFVEIFFVPNLILDWGIFFVH